MSPSVKQKTAIPVFLVTLVLACFAISRSAQAAEPSGIQNVSQFNTPFQRTFSVGIPPGTDLGDAVVNIPAGKTLVVEFVSVLGTFPAGEHPVVTAFELSNGVRANVFMNFQASSILFCDRDVFVGSQQMRLYAKDQLRMVVIRDLTAGAAHINGDVIGYLVDTP
jgi:hypothetical protein